MNSEKKQSNSFGAAEFKIVLKPTNVTLVIHDNHVVATSDKNVYDKIFNFAIKELGGRQDGF